MKYRIFKIAAGRLCALALGLCVLFGVLCLSGSMTILGGQEITPAEKNVNEIGEGADKVKEFIESFGWEVEDEPTIIKEIFIPKTFDDVYTRYNEEIQKPEGYDLLKYAGLEATLYSFDVLNYPTEDYVSANVLVRNGVVIGGDICSARLDGFMHGFSLPDGVTLPSGAQLND